MIRSVPILIGRSARRFKAAVKRALFQLLPDRILNALVRYKMPCSAQLEVTTACNLRCPLCTTHEMPRGYPRLNAAQVDNVLGACGSRLKFVSFHLLGEPLLNPDLFRFVGRCERAGVRTSFSTNGMLLHRHIDAILDSGLSHISIALDGADAADYARYRIGGDFARVVRNIRTLVAAKRRRGSAHPVIQVQMIMFSYNEDREEEARALLEGLGTDVVSFKRPSYEADRPEARAFLDQVDHADTSRRWARSVSDPERLYKNQRMCPQLERATVLSDGSVVSCCLDARGQTAFGNVNDTDFKRIWRGRDHRRVIERFQRRQLGTCARCTLAYERE